tara:strand:- start:24 stop:242 length:219 start_codon:yes stop_codon:yes gene_type:complete
MSIKTIFALSWSCRNFIWSFLCWWWLSNDTLFNFLGVTPTYAVTNEAYNILATSVSGSTTHYLKNKLLMVDY